jgi:hypothetical protein
MRQCGNAAMRQCGNAAISSTLHALNPGDAQDDPLQVRRQRRDRAARRLHADRNIRS